MTGCYLKQISSSKRFESLSPRLESILQIIAEQAGAMVSPFFCTS